MKMKRVTKITLLITISLMLSACSFKDTVYKLFGCPGPADRDSICR
ncbi:hypothetical protein MNBD_GAMMA12-1237 [hydrothermal vent metagenome]|uniref:Lipoprotein n=1 Tax=hydrothermal vent metagenome TaxID=652676 RepID=A0A3B0Z045_9ZZZZ